MMIHKNKFLVNLIELGLGLAEKQEKDKWAYHNETKTIMESVQFLTKRLNIFLKFSEHFIEEMYAGGQINQDMVCRVYKLLYEKTGDFTKEQFDEGGDDFLPKLLQEKKIYKLNAIVKLPCGRKKKKRVKSASKARIKDILVTTIVVFGVPRKDLACQGFLGRGETE